MFKGPTAKYLISSFRHSERSVNSGSTEELSYFGILCDPGKGLLHAWAMVRTSQQLSLDSHLAFILGKKKQKKTKNKQKTNKNKK